MDAEDQRSNREAVERGGTIFAVIEIAYYTFIFIRTEADRSRTTIIAAEEY